MSAPTKQINPRKLQYEQTLLSCFEKYRKMLVIGVDNVGSRQMSNTRHELRGKAQILMGKNTVIRKILRREMKSDPGLRSLLEKIRGNIGFIFTNGDLLELRDKVVSKQDPAPAKTGQVAPCDVYVEPGPTGLDPGQTAFFQALNIATKINRGAIEIIARVKMCEEGTKVSASAAGLLSKLKMMPFSFGIKVQYVYEGGSCYDAKVLDLSEDDIMKKFVGGLVQASCLALGLSYPCMASIPHLMSNAVRKIIAFSIVTSYKLKIAEPFEAFLANPDAFKVAAAPGAGGESEEKKEEKKERRG
uniref:60S acidic ribosomal protein P0 n=1 Tax=Lotharella oceanica TaxID=641309 RepID=A0A7S2TQ39_9EUKA|mmetsp:Transcript_24805/g.46356  ORF Transcript_24805/g.46356 Transcript_24805/m.46356 type:complete len:302 (+) Transcript_24805:45-950(+)